LVRSRLRFVSIRAGAMTIGSGREPNGAGYAIVMASDR
jgi:hypothetical protein